MGSSCEGLAMELESLKREIQELKARLNQESSQTSNTYQSLLHRVAALELRLAY